MVRGIWLRSRSSASFKGTADLEEEKDVVLDVPVESDLTEGLSNFKASSQRAWSQMNAGMLSGEMITDFSA